MCKRCSELESSQHVCDWCKKVLPVYPGMFGAGFESRTVDHFHQSQAGRHTMETPIHVPLCLSCYRKDQIKHGESPLYAPPYTNIEVEYAQEPQEMIA